MVWKTGMMGNFQKLDKRKISKILLCTEPEAQNVGFYHSEESYYQQSGHSIHTVPLVFKSLLE
jgi:hypothetical protein